MVIFNLFHGSISDCVLFILQLSYFCDYIMLSCDHLLTGKDVIDWLISWHFVEDRPCATLMASEMIRYGFFNVINVSLKENTYEKDVALQEMVDSEDSTYDFVSCYNYTLFHVPGVHYIEIENTLLWAILLQPLACVQKTLLVGKMSGRDFLLLYVCFIFFFFFFFIKIIFLIKLNAGDTHLSIPDNYN